VRAERVALVAALCAAAAWPAAAPAATARATLELTGGGLSVAGPARVDLPPVRLAGDPVTVEAPVGPFRVTDTRPGAPGWTLVARADRPADALGRAMAAPLVLLSVPAPAGLAPARSPGPASLEQPRVLMGADPGEGAGSWAVTPTLRLTVPPDTAAGLYSATVVVTVT
jgi:hypothetical protein